MRRAHWSWLLWPLLPAWAGAVAQAGCAGTPEGAVLQALAQATPAGAQTGYRVRNVVMDPLLGRAFVQVEQCGHPERPVVLLPFAKVNNLRGTTGAPGIAAAMTPQDIGPSVAVGSDVAVAMGDAHTRLTVHGRLLQSAAVGSEVEVQLASLSESDLPGESAVRRVRGRLTAADRVEVQP